MVRKLLASPVTWFFLTLIAVVSHVYWAISVKSCVPMSRVGSLITLFGVATAARPIIRKGAYTWIAEMWFKDVDPRLIGGEKAESDEDFQVREDAFSLQLMGPLLIFVGTIVWGYGDLFCELESQ